MAAEIAKLTKAEFRRLMGDHDFVKYAAELSRRCEEEIKKGTYRYETPKLLQAKNG